MTNGHDLQSHGLQKFADRTGGLALSATGARGADGDDRLDAFDHRAAGSYEFEIGAHGVDEAGSVHHVFVSDVAVGKDHFIHTVLDDDVAKIFLGQDGNTLGVKIAGQHGRVFAAVNIGNLSSGESDDFDFLVVAIEDVEVMEVAARRAHDDDSLARHFGSLIGAESYPSRETPPSWGV